ncbi:MAG: ATP-binding cassette domain-containing protein [Candidatus Cloacimonetes bacterium]|nr:ATP-binding cassette domain-containing protein [Candidatus Cloacimonadota bacterium]
MIELKNISIGFNEQSVLQNINLQIREQETLLIVGQSGSGKSVLVKIIDGLLPHDEGSVIIDGEDLQNSRGQSALLIRQKLAMLFQGSALLDSLNVYQNVALPLLEHTRLSESEIFQQVTDKLAMVGLSGIMKRFPSELSGGMKKRVALARAIITNPKYIIYDEPTTGLDPVIAGEIIELIKNLHQQQEVATIIVTHDLYCIERIGGRIVMLADTDIIFDGNLDEFKNAGDSRIRRFLYSTDRIEI